MEHEGVVSEESHVSEVGRCFAIQEHIHGVVGGEHRLRALGTVSVVVQLHVDGWGGGVVVDVGGETGDEEDSIESVVVNGGEGTEVEVVHLEVSARVVTNCAGHVGVVHGLECGRVEETGDGGIDHRVPAPGRHVKTLRPDRL